MQCSRYCAGTTSQLDCCFVQGDDKLLVLLAVWDCRENFLW